ncbi:sigma factor-like helix-turn-helix DNA-binding protein [Paenibacillus dakarensis]|uniref:sigma factor-like helix-turn-helix DNA-binding protein n=1 Tax=Paenibacillus dakarensis TaxID=1527293 RepID=UPI0006D53D0D|nr:sigma factor-like helix-turn-helix DNA-binding protein [Paenibacillus dakarensis]
MDNQTVINLLTDYRSYKFAVMNLGGIRKEVSGDEGYINRRIYEERTPFRLSNYDKDYDRDRYGRIITTLESAVDFVLSDDQRSIIRMKYMERNTLNLSEIADRLHKDRKTVSTQHKKAINSLAKALVPFKRDYMEITNIDHMFDAGWEYKEPA